MVEKELVSVVITTYQRKPEMVLRAVKSVVNQTYKNLDILIIDDSPHFFEKRKDVEKEIINLKDYRIKYFKNSKNIGACASRNLGIKMSQGEYVAFLDDDDQWKAEKIKKQLEIMRLDSMIGLVYCKQIVIDEIRNKKTENNRKCYSGYVFNQLLLTNFIGSTSFPLIRMECFKNSGAFNEKLLSQQDWELWLRISEKYKVDYIDDYLVNYYIHSGERIGTNIKKQIQGHEFITTLYEPYLMQNKKLLCIRMIRITPFFVKEKKFKHAFLLYLKALKIYPFNIKYNIKYLVLSLINIFM